MEGSSPQERFEELIRQDSRFHPEAYKFVYDALDFTVRNKYSDVDEGSDDESQSNQHVTGQDLLEGLRVFALEEFGCMAATVFACRK